MLNFFLFVILCISWGSTWIAIKVGVETVPPLFYAGTRFLAAGVLILAVFAMIHGKKAFYIKRNDINPLIVMSSLVVSICFALIFWGEQYVSASITAIVVQGMIPIFLPFFAFMLGYEHLSLHRIISIAVGIVGLFCIFLPGILNWHSGGSGQEHNLFQFVGLVAIVLGTLAYCYGSVLGRPLLGGNSGVAIAGWNNLIGGVIILIFSFVLEFPVFEITEFLKILSYNALFAWIWLVIIGSAVGFVLYIVLLKAWGASKVSPYAFATPVVAILLDYVLFGNTINELEILGLIIIFVALAFAFYKPMKKLDQSNE